MQKVLRALLAVAGGILVLFLLARLVTLLVIGQWSWAAWLDPLGALTFWKTFLAVAGVAGGLTLIFLLLRPRPGMSLPLALALTLGVAGLGALGYRTIDRAVKEHDQRREYHYAVPELPARAPAPDRFAADGRQRGASIFGWDAVSEEGLRRLDELGVEWVAVMPFDYMRAADEPAIEHLDELPDLRRKDETMIALLRLARSQGKHVMLKPHLWIEAGWRNDLGFADEAQWDEWFDNYAALTLQYARVAAAGEAEIFCIGTEMIESVRNQPTRWRELIGQIREVYDGELTYAANWDAEYDEIPFWNLLDYVGVQAYFPMPTEGEITVPKLRAALRPELDTLGQFAARVGRPVLFTEYGFRRIRGTAVAPWSWPSSVDLLRSVRCDDCQARAYGALWAEAAARPWFRGGYLWEYDFLEDDGPDAHQYYGFSPRHAPPTEAVIRKLYRGG